MRSVSLAVCAGMLAMACSQGASHPVDPAEGTTTAAEGATTAAEPTAADEQDDETEAADGDESADEDVAAPMGPSAGTMANFALDGQRLEVTRDVEFERGSAVMRPWDDPALQEVVQYLGARPDVTLLRIEGHTAIFAAKDRAYAAGVDLQALSEQRAEAVGRWLVGKGVACTRLVAVGMGARSPVAASDTLEHRQANERIWFVNAELGGRPIGGAATDGGGQVVSLCGCTTKWGPDLTAQQFEARKPYADAAAEQAQSMRVAEKRVRWCKANRGVDCSNKARSAADYCTCFDGC